MSSTFFVDSSVVALALGGQDSRLASCRELLATATLGVQFHASVEMVQEVMFHWLRMDPRPDAVDQARRLLEAFALHDLTVSTLSRSIHLAEVGPIVGRDAVHAAGALDAGFTEIVSADRDFDGVAGLRRLTPEQALARVQISTGGS